MTTPVGDTDPAAPWLNHGDNAWQLTAATLVGLQSLSGLSAIYAGMVKKKWVINSMFMVFYAFAMVLVCWCLWGYKMAFGEQWGSFPLVGVPGPVVAMDWELRQAQLPAAGLVQNYGMASMIYFQFVFAAITLVLIAGSLLGRMNFLAWMLFVPLWLTFVSAISKDLGECNGRTDSHSHTVSAPSASGAAGFSTNSASSTTPAATLSTCPPAPQAS